MPQITLTLSFLLLSYIAINSGMSINILRVNKKPSLASMTVLIMMAMMMMMVTVMS